MVLEIAAGYVTGFLFHGVLVMLLGFCFMACFLLLPWYCFPDTNHSISYCGVAIAQGSFQFQSTPYSCG
uniref:Uncharacterized protein n=1 Tax=Nelumbo nucifera TaxID=4432 RepID=A0A822Z6S3_NELNU|nr:TPA_asm: hypothetical protein HUJ06_013412 [Nelumbo nucifera]